MTLRKKRPTREDADATWRRGSYGVGPDDYVSDSERLSQIDRFDEFIFQLVRDELAHTRRLDLTILRGHSIIDIAITQFITLASRNQAAFENTRFTFQQKLTIAYALGFSTNPLLLGTIDSLTQARNRVAHHMEVNLEAVNAAIRYSTDLSAAEISALTDRQRAGIIRRIVAGICGSIIGNLTGMSAVEISKDTPRAHGDR